ncbi:class A beta-lactamase-related serine hydrolase [Hymenobacter gummosus]|uniref:Class A beta-lactamase-related serine hydrolase n=1 Tax=Hymenobacter gummosus TaxID=1776032 RepID=A0A3S0IMJ1_9BACT|nr:serine hydrolase domain-containing protein [Hymenobacter gummosus]RTQ48901.1 class A beta-lactamase-related serine hydrolase [Hymenobacter gummosus]
MRRILTVLFLLQVLLTQAQQPELMALMQQHKVPGLQVTYSKGRSTKTYALGLRQAGTGQAVDANTVFQAASLSKVVLAYAALRLLDRGLLDLDRPLLAYAPNPRLAAEPRAARLTARMVLTHTTGLPNWAAYPLGPDWATSELRLKYAPDSCWSYSGEGFVLLQHTLEQISGQSWQALAQQEVLGPLGLTRSSYVWQPAFAANASFGHDAAGQPTDVKQFAAPNAGFSLVTTAADYSRFVQALLRGRGLRPATARLLRTPANAANRCGVPPSPADARVAWACGVGLVETSRGPALWHWGDNGDAKGFFLAFPGRRESLVFLANGAGGLQLTDEVLRLFFGPGEYWTTQWLAAEK